MNVKVIKQVWLVIVIFVAMPLNGAIMVKGNFALGVSLCLVHLPFLLGVLQDIKNSEE